MHGSSALRDHLVYLLEGGGAHRSLAHVFRDVPTEVRGIRPEGLLDSLWELMEHIRLPRGTGRDRPATPGDLARGLTGAQIARRGGPGKGSNRVTPLIHPTLKARFVYPAYRPTLPRQEGWRDPADWSVRRRP